MKKLFKINEEKLQRAINISHSYFWLADCPTVEKNVRKYISKTYSKPKTIAEYAVIVCLETVKKERLIETEINRTKKAKKIT